MKSSTGWWSRCSGEAGEVGVEVELELLLDGREGRAPVGQQVDVPHERAPGATAGLLGEERGVHPAGDVGRLLGEPQLLGLAGEVGDVAGADDLGGVAQRGQPAQVGAQLGADDLPHLGEPERVRVLDHDLVARLVVLGQLAGQPLVQLTGREAGPDVARDDVDGGRAAVDVEERELLEVALVEVDDPLRLVEPARVGLGRLDLGLRHVEAEPLQGAGEGARAAAPGTGHQDERGGGRRHAGHPIGRCCSP